MDRPVVGIVKDHPSSWTCCIFIQGEQHGIANIWLFKLLHKIISQQWKPEEGKQTTNMLVWYPQ